MRLVGEKRPKHYTEFLKEFLPSDIKVYVEPFGGTFNMNKFLEKRPVVSIYNDINTYEFEIECDVELHKDYKEVIEKYDSLDTVFYIDPPYFGKEFWYDLPKNNKEFHIELKELVDRLEGKAFISYCENPFIEKLYEGFRIERYKGDTYYLKNEILIVA